jgi:hypothetical protein
MLKNVNFFNQFLPLVSIKFKRQQNRNCGKTILLNIKKNNPNFSISFYKPLYLGFLSDFMFFYRTQYFFIKKLKNT